MTQFNATGYDIERPTGVCAFTGRPLEADESYFATLVELPEPPPTADHDPDQGQTATQGTAQGTAVNALRLKRLDVSTQAWEQGHRPENLFSFWKSKVPQPTQKKKLFVDDAVLMNLLRRLADTDQPQRNAFRYVLALILMRKKLIRYDGTRKESATVDGQQVIRDWWQFTPKLDLSKGPLGKWNDQETIEVLDPHLDAAQIEQVTGQLGEILEAEF